VAGSAVGGCSEAGTSAAGLSSGTAASVGAVRAAHAAIATTRSVNRTHLDRSFNDPSEIKSLASSAAGSGTTQPDTNGNARDDPQVRLEMLGSAAATCFYTIDNSQIVSIRVIFHKGDRGHGCRIRNAARRRPPQCTIPIRQIDNFAVTIALNQEIGGRQMRALMWTAIIAAAFCVAGTANAACLAGVSRNCVNFDFVPPEPRQTTAGDRMPLAKPASLSGHDAAYTGPTVGVAPNVRQAPEVGYRWSID
jgi:hypothetical protein